MIEILKNNKNIIINTDIDGVLSGLILHNYMDCQIVGFSNSESIVWIDKSKVKSIYDAVYIDMFVPNSNVKCIDQHIVSANITHHEKLKLNKNKLNPNIDNPRFHLPNSSYYLKYPFGTIHYIIAKLEAEGVKIDINFFNKIDDLFFIDLLLRADDAMQTTVDSNYKDNARYWWRWLYELSLKSNRIKEIGIYVYNLNPASVNNIKSKTTQLLMSPATFACKSPDGGYKLIIDEDGKLFQRVKDYFNFLARSTGLNCFNLNLNLTKFEGIAQRTCLDDTKRNELIFNNTIEGNEIFSYAFVRSNSRNENFSYTIM